MIHPKLDQFSFDERSKVRIVVAMSGGVDSSVAAALLKEQGFDVVGMALKTFDLPEGVAAVAKSCCSLDDMEDARRVCEKIGIRFYVMDVREAFEAKVIDPFVHSYLQGKTPNPCINCNTFIKFDILMQKAAELDADFVATGHYARLEYRDDGELVHLLRGRDSKKDQSYFLYTLTQAQLKKLLFPVGFMVKEEVRRLAVSLKLPVAEKNDSQEICFVPDDGYASFIEERVAKSLRPPGDIKINDAVVGQHEGIHKYTVGQRRGLNLTLDYKEPLYVDQIDPETNTVHVTIERGLLRNALLASEANWIVDPKLVHDRNLLVKVRSAAEPVEAQVHLGVNNQIFIRFENPQRALTPGQGVAIYEADELLGGGWIEEVFVLQPETEEEQLPFR